MKRCLHNVEFVLTSTCICKCVSEHLRIDRKVAGEIQHAKFPELLLKCSESVEIFIRDILYYMTFDSKFLCIKFVITHKFLLLNHVFNRKRRSFYQFKIDKAFLLVAHLRAICVCVGNFSGRHEFVWDHEFEYTCKCEYVSAHMRKRDLCICMYMQNFIWA